ncbi:MAG TPA: glycosyltransferase family 4 protein, partial [Armatimonadota bacterium]|nr:glycosyltransferase family 4 protein [Armatimonadota bacterium]
AEGGIKSHVLTLINGLDRSKFEPVLICPPDTSWAKEANCRVIRLNLVGEIRPWRDFWTAVRLRFILWRIKPSVLHIHSTKAGFVGRLALIMMRRRPKVILTVHSFVFDERVGKWRRRLVPRIERRLLRYTDRIVAVSQALRDELVSEMGLRPEKIQVIYNGIKFHDLPKPQHAGIRIGTVARLAPQKGVDHFLRAAALVKKRFPEAEFKVIGDGPNRYWLDMIVREHGLEDCVEFMGFRRDALQVAAGWDVFVLASTRETFGLALAEAMSQGVPVVASDIGGIPEMVDGETTGLLAEVGNAEDFAENICRLLEDPELAGRIGKAGNEFVRASFTSEGMMEEIQGLYERQTPNVEQEGEQERE